MKINASRITGIMGKAGAGKDTVADLIIDSLNKHPKIYTTTNSPNFFPVKYSFAGPLKEMCSYIFDIPLVWMYDRKLKETQLYIQLNNQGVKERAYHWVEEQIAKKDKWVWHLARSKFSINNPHIKTRTEEFSLTLLDILEKELRKTLKPWEMRDHNVFQLSPRLLLQIMGTEVVRVNIDDNFWSEIKDDTILENRTILIPDCRFASEVDFILNNGGNIIVVENEDLPKKQNEHISEKFVDEVEDYMLINFPANSIYTIPNSFSEGSYSELKTYVNDFIEHSL